MPKFKITSMAQLKRTYFVEAETAEAAEAAWVESEESPADDEIIAEDFDSIEPVESATA